MRDFHRSWSKSSKSVFPTVVEWREHRSDLANARSVTWDPNSPYIFVLCLERISHRLQKEVYRGQWKPLKASRNGPGISHLFFADDLLFFAESSSVQMKVIVECLNDFAKALGQRVNFEKFLVYVSPNCNEDVAKQISIGAGIPMAGSLERYLGTQLVHD